MPPQLLDFVESVLQRPAMYTPSGDFDQVVAFLEGFISGRAGAGGPVQDWNTFEDWLAHSAGVPPLAGTRRTPLTAIASTAELLARLREYRALQPHPDPKSPPASAEEAIEFHSEGFLEALRPYGGDLPHEHFQGLLRSLRVLAPRLASAHYLSRGTLSALWGVWDLTRRWALDEGSMLERNQLLTPSDRTTLLQWHDAMSYAVMMLLDGQDVELAFEKIDALPARGAG